MNSQKKKMSSDENVGKRCMVIMNTILLFLALGLFGFSIFLTLSDHPSVQAISGYSYLITVVAIVITCFAIVGYCASCGGCFLYMYSCVIHIICTVCVLVTIASFVLYYLCNKDPDLNNFIFKAVDTFTMVYIKNEDNAESWKNYQNLLNCCGYNGEGKTGASCSLPTFNDCRADMMNILSNYLLYISIFLCVVTVVLYILACTAQYSKKGCC